MAEGLLFDAAWKLLEVLGSPAFQEIDLAFGVKDEIEKLKRTVETIKAVLLDAEEQHTKKNHQVTLWLRKLKDVFYDADDLLDDFATELKEREAMTGNKIAKEVRLFFSSSNQIVYGLKIAHEIKTIRKRLAEIANNRTFHLSERHDDQQVVNLERDQTYSFVLEEKVIGRNDDKNKIIELLLAESNDDKNVSVIPISGMGGLGKTTLAQLVYNDEKVINHFPLRMWVCISETFDLKIIVEKILRSAINAGLQKVDMEQLQNQLREVIDGKKYLLVLDDDWNEDCFKWSKLEDLLMNGARGSKILLTTRHLKVVEATRTQIPSYTLKELPEVESWNLFTKWAFNQGIEPTDSRLVAIGKDIVEKCFGVPLIIKTIGSLLYGKDAGDWLRFKEVEMSKIGQNSSILETLKLSYDHLSSNLKQCFVYCALFPKDHHIKRQKLIHLWMAQGFLVSSNNNRPEDIGSAYFEILLSRSFFQEAKYDELGNIIKCKMHDLMHDLAQSVAGSEFALTTSHGKTINDSTRYVSFDYFDSDFNTSHKFSQILCRSHRIRAISSQTIHLGSNLNMSNFAKTLSSFKCLHTLNLSKSGVKKLPSSIFLLKRLRYLDLSYNRYAKKLFPSSMSRLRNLQTLDVSHCYHLEELPRDIGKMSSLRHLIDEGCTGLTNNMPRGLGLLTGLQTLPFFPIKQNNLELRALKELSHLRGNLYISGLKHMENAATPRLAVLEEKQYLQYLNLRWESFNDAAYNDGEAVIDDTLLDGLKPHPNLKNIYIEYFGGVKLSSWFSSLTNLTSITLNDCYRCRNISPLDQLSSLEKLVVMDFHSLEYFTEGGSNDSSSKSSTVFFKSLKELKLYDCRKLKGWWRRDDGATTQMTELPSFPCLSKLQIHRCRNLTYMPLYPTLQNLILSVNSSELTSSSLSAPLPKLKSLSIEFIDDLESLPERGLQKLTSLQHMSFQCCRDFLINDDNGMPWQSLRSLHSLEFSWLPKLESLPKGLQYVTTLQHLEINSCDNLKGLPEWIRNLTSLAVLKISYCPQLLKRYGNNKSDDWTKIAHIPNIKIYFTWIQKEGRYRLNQEGCSSS